MTDRSSIVWERYLQQVAMRRQLQRRMFAHFTTRARAGDARAKLTMHALYYSASIPRLALIRKRHIR